MIRYKFFLNILYVFIFMIFCYTFLSVSVIYINKHQQMITGIQDSSSLFLQQTAEKIDSRILTVTNVLNQLQDSESMKDYLANTNPSDYEQLQLQKYIKKLISGYGQNLCSIGVLKPDGNVVVGSEVLGNYDTYMQHYGVANLKKSETLGKFSSKNINYFSVRGTVQDHEVSDGKYFIVIRKISTYNGLNYIAFLAYDENNLLPKLDTSEESAFVITDKNGILTGNGSNKIVNKVMYQFNNIFANSPENTKPVEYSGNIINKVKSQYTDWYYMYVRNNNVMVQGTRKLLSMSILMGIILIFIGSVIVYLIAKRVHKPIRDVIQQMENADRSDTIDEFSFIKDEAIRMSKAYENLRKIVESSSTSLREKVMDNFLKGNLVKRERDELVRQYDLTHLSATPLSVTVIDIETSSENGNVYTPDKILEIKREIKNLFFDNLGHCLAFEPIDSGRDSFMAVFTNLEDDKIKAHLINLIMFIDTNYSIHLKAAVGLSCEGLDTLEDSYRSAWDMMEYAMTFPLRQNVFMAGEYKAVDEFYYYPLDLERDLINFLVRGNVEHACELIDKVIDENILHRRLKMESLSMFFIAMVGTLGRALGLLRLTAGEVFGDGMLTYVDLKMCKNTDELKERIHNVFSDIVQRVLKDSRRNEVEMSEKLLQYIHQNYKQDISLADIARHFNLSQNYISSLFKNMTKSNFKDYLNSYRVKVAIKFLEGNPELKLAELASLVGCNNVYTLLRLFNKYEGITPGQYIKNLLENRDK